MEDGRDYRARHEANEVRLRRVDNLDRITYPSGTTGFFRYDLANRPSGVFDADGNPIATVGSYHASGQIAELRRPNHPNETFAYDPARYWLKEIAGGPIHLRYGYYPVGNIRQIDDLTGRAAGQMFAYDRLDRLTVVSGLGADTFQDDAVGNRRGRAAGTLTYNYNEATQHLTSITGPGPGLGMGNYVFNAAGELETDPAGTYTYTPFSLLQTATVAGRTTAYRYDGDGVRKTKDSPEGIRYYVHGPGAQVLAEDKQAVTEPVLDCENIYLGSRLVASIGDMTPVAPTPIVVRLTSPLAGDAYAAGDDIPLAAEVTLTSGSSNGSSSTATGSRLASDTSAPYSATWTGVAAREHRLYARAVDSTGKSYVSPTVTIRVIAVGRIRSVFVSPNPVDEGQEATITVTGTTPCGAIGLNYGDGNAVVFPTPFTTGTFTYTSSYTWTGNGPRTLTATGHGNCRDSRSTTVNVRGNIPPLVAITSPAVNASFVWPASVVVAAEASDPDGTIAHVQFFANGSPIGAVAAAPYTVVWVPDCPGSIP